MPPSLPHTTRPRSVQLGAGPSTLIVDSPRPARTTTRSPGSAERLLSRCTDTLGHEDEVSGTGLDGVRATWAELHPQQTSEDVDDRLVLAMVMPTGHHGCLGANKSRPHVVGRDRLLTFHPRRRRPRLPVARSHDDDLLLPLRHAGLPPMPQPLEIPARRSYAPGVAWSASSCSLGQAAVGPSSTVPTVPVGYLLAVTLVAWCTLFAVAPPRPRQSSPSNLSFRFGYLLNELPFVAFYWLLASTLLAFGQGDLDSPGGWVAFGLAVLTTVGLVVVAWRGLRAGPAVDHALREGLGAGWRGRHRRRDGRPAAPPPSVRPHPVRAVPRPPSRCRAVGEHQLRRRGEAESARRLPPSLPSAGRPHARLPARRRVPQRQEEPRGASPPLPAREPGLGVHQRELPPESGREVS